MWSIKNNISWKSMSNYQNSCSLLQSVKLQYFNGLLHLSILSKCQQSNHFSLLCNGLSRFGNGGFDCNRQPTTRAHTHTHTHTHTRLTTPPRNIASLGSLPWSCSKCNLHICRLKHIYCLKPPVILVNRPFPQSSFWINETKTFLGFYE